MEFAKDEIKALDKIIGDARDEVAQLTELELVLVSGGTGDITLG
jgi:hypothetical protein